MTFNTLAPAYTAFTKNKLFLLCAIILELLFFISVVGIHYYYFLPTSESLLKLTSSLETEMQDLSDSELYKLGEAASKNQEFMTAYLSFLATLGYFALTLFFAYVIFRLPLWYFSLRSLHKNMPILPVLIKFPLLAIFWFIVLFFSLILCSTLFQTMPALAKLIMTLLLGLLWYFSSISYTLIPSQQTFKKTFIYGISHAKRIVPAALINALIIFIALSIPFTWAKQNPILILCSIALIIAPALAFTRIHLIIATWQKTSS